MDFRAAFKPIQNSNGRNLGLWEPDMATRCGEHKLRAPF
jgi:hypothetical protein